MLLRLLGCAIAFGLAGCSSKPLDKEQATKTLKSQAAEVRLAMLQEDHQRMADLTHPLLIEKMGGRSKFVQRLDSMAAEMKGKGFRFVEIVFSEPSKLVEASGEVYAILPFKLDMTAPGNIPGQTSSFLICVSKDTGTSWTFLDGNGVAGDREKLKQVLPKFPSSLALPAKQEPSWQR